MPIQEFTVEDLRLVIGQQRGLRYLIPIAVEKLEEHPLAEGHMYAGDLLMALTRVNDEFWEEHSEWRRRVGVVLERALDRLASIPADDPWSPVAMDSDQLSDVDRDGLEPRIREVLPGFV